MAKVSKEVVPVVHNYVVTFSEEEFTILAKIIGHVWNPDDLISNMWKDVFKQVYDTEAYNNIKLTGHLSL